MSVAFQKEDIQILNGLILSINRALWGEVIPSLRKVRLEWKPGDKTAWIIFYHHGQITDDIEDHYSCIEFEVGADFWEPMTDFKVIRCDYPSPLPKGEYTIYMRKEPFEDLMFSRLRSNEVEILKNLKLYIQRALWGKVIPSLRLIKLMWKSGEEIAWIVFYHDGEITDEIQHHYSCIEYEVGANFYQVITNFKVVCCIYPDSLPKEGYTIYARKEPFKDPAPMCGRWFGGSFLSFLFGLGRPR